MKPIEYLKAINEAGATELRELKVLAGDDADLAPAAKKQIDAAVAARFEAITRRGK